MNRNYEGSADHSGNRERLARQYYNSAAVKNARAGGVKAPTISAELSALAQLAKLGPDKYASSFASNLSGVEQKLAKDGLGSFVKRLGSENKRLLAEAKARDTAASRLKASTAAVAAAVKVRNDDYASFKGAIFGAWDITSAGQDADGKVTGGGLLASEKQQLTSVRAWSAGMKKLISSRVFPAVYLRTLLGKGPDSLPTVQALLSLSGAQMKDFANTEKAIGALSYGAQSVASLGAHKLDDPAINAAAAIQRADARALANREKALRHDLQDFATRVEHALGHIHGTFDFNRGTLSLAAKTDEKKTRRRKVSR